MAYGEPSELLVGPAGPLFCALEPTPAVLTYTFTGAVLAGVDILAREAAAAECSGVDSR